MLKNNRSKLLLNLRLLFLQNHNQYKKCKQEGKKHCNQDLNNLSHLTKLNFLTIFLKKLTKKTAKFLSQ